MSGKPDNTVGCWASQPDPRRAAILMPIPKGIVKDLGVEPKDRLLVEGPLMVNGRMGFFVSRYVP